ncbi:MAG: tRNA (adenosine(37)-N6)-threonylcarbamoyltransferase complex dimerization subunit type 1 TsaB [Oscillospiraceae bacterium]|nr:tRNA (adenosine(37)-N6)-threonylcarbamoyltransferase complex dimerization subunit type 1 TsaB [Oscillospiraceae bacterium]
MIIFALDSSGSAASAAVMKDGKILAESYSNVGLTHSVTLLEICDQVFARASLTPADVDVFAVSEGPGSFTGLRIGVSLIKGFAFQYDEPCISVSTMEAIAGNIRSPGTLIVPVNDARRDRVYYAAFRDGVRLAEDSVAEISELPGVLSEYGDFCLLAGDAAQKTASLIGSSFRCEAVPEHITMCRASSVAAAALVLYNSGSTLSVSELAPKYHQLSQAERERNKQINN